MRTLRNIRLSLNKNLCQLPFKTPKAGPMLGMTGLRE
jgi:hypothetical protein